MDFKKAQKRFEFPKATYKQVALVDYRAMEARKLMLLNLVRVCRTKAGVI